MAIIGQSISGGTFFYTGTTGLIAATEDILLSLYWGCGIGITGTSTAIGTGQANTYIIISGCTGNKMFASNVCNNLVLNGYSDWYLPSKDELNEMYLNKDVIGNFNINDNYWSSSQYTAECAWVQFFLNGLQSGLGGKDQLYRVRPIRTY